MKEFRTCTVNLCQKRCQMDMVASFLRESRFNIVGFYQCKGDPAKDEIDWKKMLLQVAACTRHIYSICTDATRPQPMRKCLYSLIIYRYGLPMNVSVIVTFYAAKLTLPLAFISGFKPYITL